jgi:predicted RNase H-like nuclease (RuvC/YqgF family)
VVEKELAAVRAKLESERRDKASLEGQIFGMSKTITDLLQRQARVEGDAISRERQLSGLVRQREREGLAVSQELGSRERVMSKLDKRVQVWVLGVLGGFVLLRECMGQ